MKKRMVIMLTVIIICMGIVFTDYSRASNNKEPVFAIKTQQLKDGGTSIYYGLGYKVICYNQLQTSDEDSGRNDVAFGSYFLKY